MATSTSVKPKGPIFAEKLQLLRQQLEDLERGTDPDYLRELKGLEEQYNERLRFNAVAKAIDCERIERDYSNERNAILKEFEDGKIDIKEALIAELEEKRRQADYELQTVDLSDSNDLKPAIKRNLRRRQNDNSAPVDKKPRKTSPTSALKFTLSEEDINEDLCALAAVGLPSVTLVPLGSAGSSSVGVGTS